MVTSGYEYSNVGVEQLKLDAISKAATLAYQYKRMELIDVPMLEIEKDKLALQAAQQAAEAKSREENIGLGVLNLVGQLRGPRNAFQQQNVMHGINGAGVSNAVDAIAGRIAAPAYQAPQAQPQGTSLGSFIDDLYGAAGMKAPPGTNWTPSTTSPGNTQPAGQGEMANPGAAGAAGPVLPITPVAPTPYTGPMVGSTGSGYHNPVQVVQGSGEATYAGYNPAAQGQPATFTAPTYDPTVNPNTQAYMAALPNPNKIVGREFLKLGGDTQDFLLGGYEQKGYSGNDVTDYIKKGLPQFKAPTFAGVK